MKQEKGKLSHAQSLTRTTARNLFLLAAGLLSGVLLFAQAPQPVPLSPAEALALRDKWMAAPTPEVMIEKLADPVYWDSAADWSRWLVYSRTSDSTVYHTWKGDPVFGVNAVEVRAHVKAETSGTGALQLIEVCYFEVCCWAGPDGLHWPEPSTS